LYDVFDQTSPTNASDDSFMYSVSIYVIQGKMIGDLTTYLLQRQYKLCMEKSLHICSERVDTPDKKKGISFLSQKGVGLDFGKCVGEYHIED